MMVIGVGKQRSLLTLQLSKVALTAVAGYRGRNTAIKGIYASCSYSSSDSLSRFDSDI